MDFTTAIKSVFSKYATFTGRARRSEYWYFCLFSLIISLIITGISLFAEQVGTILNLLFFLAVIVPSLAVYTRRLHDTGRSGWHVVIIYAIMTIAIALLLAGIGMKLLTDPDRTSADSVNLGLLLPGFALYLAGVIYGIVLFVFMCMDSQVGTNKYGPNPKGEEEIATNDNF